MSHKIFLVMALAAVPAVPGTALARGFHGGGHRRVWWARRLPWGPPRLLRGVTHGGLSMECFAAADDIGRAAGIPMAPGPAGGGIRILAVGSWPITNN